MSNPEDALKETKELAEQQNKELEYLNDIPWVELQTINGIGSEVAGKIVNNRDFWGEFKSFYELRKISSISTQRIREITKYISKEVAK